VTRSTLLRPVLGCAGLLGCAVLGAGIRRLGVPGTLAIVAGCALAGAAASLGWHGIGLMYDRLEERRRAARRHRAPRPDRDERRRPYVPESEHETPQPWSLAEPEPGEFDGLREQFEQHIDPYLTPPPPRRPGAAAAADGQDLYAHPGRRTP
jgi:hypothetical protein